MIQLYLAILGIIAFLSLKPDFLHLFSLKTPILGRFHQRKVTVPCASSMRKGVKKVKQNKKRFSRLFLQISRYKTPTSLAVTTDKDDAYWRSKVTNGIIYYIKILREITSICVYGKVAN